jgi:tetratricopeptide (TPR) repeat protein
MESLNCRENSPPLTPAAMSGSLAVADLRRDREGTDEAGALVAQVLASAGDREDALYLSGLLHERAGRFEEAVECFRKALAGRDDLAALHSGLGRALHASGLPLPAVTSFERAVALDPGSPETRSDMAAALIDLERYDEASIVVRFALQLHPEAPDIVGSLMGNLGSALAGLGRHEEAGACYRNALKLPAGPAVIARLFLNLGRNLRRQERFDEALDLLRRFPGGTASAEVQHELGMTLTLAGHFQEGLACIRRSLAWKPLPETHYDYCMALLRTGDFPQGWQEYEWRWRAYGKRAGSLGAVRGFAEPQWDGSQFPYRTLLVHAEQGLGDTLQFARYLPLAAARGGTVILEVQPALVRLLGSLQGVSQIIARGEALPHFGLQCPLLSLPLAFGTTLPTIPPPIPYRASTGVRGAGPLRVGIVWAGAANHPNNRNRSVSLDSLAPLFTNHSVRFYSLQVGPPAADLERSEFSGRVRDLSPALDDFTDTADALREIDLLAARSGRQPVVSGKAPVPPAGARQLGGAHRPGRARTGTARRRDATGSSPPGR